MKSFGVIGAGNMGGGMVRNLLSKGWQVHVHDVDAKVMAQMGESGAVRHHSPQSLAQACATLAIVVVDQAQVEEVLHGKGHEPGGLLSVLGPRHTVLLCPTLGADDVVNAANHVSACGASLIDAPMSGGPLRAAMGQMSLMVACPDEVFEGHADLLHALANPVVHVSQRVGDGARTKLVNNLLAAINLVGACEVMNLALQMGLNPETTLQVMQSSSGQSWIAGDRIPRALQADWAPRAHMTLLGKDTQLAMQMAQGMGASMPLGQVATQAFARACESGWAQLDDAAMLASLRADPPPVQP